MSSSSKANADPAAVQGKKTIMGMPVGVHFCYLAAYSFRHRIASIETATQFGLNRRQLTCETCFGTFSSFFQWVVLLPAGSSCQIGASGSR